MKLVEEIMREEIPDPDMPEPKQPSENAYLEFEPFTGADGADAMAPFISGTEYTQEKIRQIVVDMMKPLGSSDSAMFNDLMGVVVGHLVTKTNAMMGDRYAEEFMSSGYVETGATPLWNKFRTAVKPKE